MKKPVESTSQRTIAVPHQAKWITLREDRSCDPDTTYAFTDGSSLGGFGAVLVRGEEILSAFGRIDPDTTRNVGAELEGLILALRHAREGEEMVIVSDYLGVAAWMTGNWRIKTPEVQERVARAERIIEAKGLIVSFCHHAGHQSDASDFTHYNALADRLAAAANSRSATD